MDYRKPIVNKGRDFFLAVCRRDEDLNTWLHYATIDGEPIDASGGSIEVLIPYRWEFSGKYYGNMHDSRIISESMCRRNARQ